METIKKLKLHPIKTAFAFAVLAFVLLTGAGCVAHVQPTLPKSEPLTTDKKVVDNIPLGELGNFRVDGYTEDGRAYQIVRKWIENGKEKTTYRFNSAYNKQMIGGTVEDTAIAADAYISIQDPTTNYGTLTALFTRSSGETGNRHAWLNLTTPADPGGAGANVVTDVVLYLYVITNPGQTDDTTEIHQVTRSNCVESQITWNKCNSTQSWTSPGGDYSATIIDTSASCNTDNSYLPFYLMGTNSDNPLTIDWGQQVDLLIKTSNYGATSYGCWFESLENAGGHDGIYDITYEAAPAQGGSGSSNSLKSARRRQGGGE